MRVLSPSAVNGEGRGSVCYAKPLLWRTSKVVRRDRGRGVSRSEPCALSSKNDVTNSSGFVSAKRSLLKTPASSTRNHYKSRCQKLCAGIGAAACRVQNPAPCRREITSSKLGVSPRKSEGYPSRDLIFTVVPAWRTNAPFPGLET